MLFLLNSLVLSAYYELSFTFTASKILFSAHTTFNFKLYKNICTDNTGVSCFTAHDKFLATVEAQVVQY